VHGRQDTINGDDRGDTVVQQGDDKNHEGREVEFVGEGEGGEADDDTDGEGVSVDGVAAHTLEDDTGLTDSVDDGGETGLIEDDISSTVGGVSGTSVSDTNIGTGESGGVVGSITSHSAKVAETLQTLDDLVLVLGEDTSETIGVQNHLVEVGVLAAGGGVRPSKHWRGTYGHRFRDDDRCPLR
jgi:hypothetical protein